MRETAVVSKDYSTDLSQMEHCGVLSHPVWWTLCPLISVNLLDQKRKKTPSSEGPIITVLTSALLLCTDVTYLHRAIVSAQVLVLSKVWCQQFGLKNPYSVNLCGSTCTTKHLLTSEYTAECVFAERFLDMKRNFRNRTCFIHYLMWNQMKYLTLYNMKPLNCKNKDQ